MGPSPWPADRPSKQGEVDQILVERPERIVSGILSGLRKDGEVHYSSCNSADDTGECGREDRIVLRDEHQVIVISRRVAELCPKCGMGQRASNLTSLGGTAVPTLKVLCIEPVPSSA